MNARTASLCCALAVTTALPAGAQTAVDTASAIHLLSRATYGIAPGDLTEVLRLGTEAWLERQLHPQRIDDSALDARLARFPTIGAEPAELMRDYAPPRPRPDSATPRTPEQRRMRRARSPQRLLGELVGARVQRAVYSERQLEQLMTEFWYDHFNVFFGKSLDRYLIDDFERSAIRPHVFGRFEDMLLSTARHPAMLFYLDNWTSAAPDSLAGDRPRHARARRPRGREPGLNENYARELLELHTLGVDGGYTQADVVAVARALTGWTIDPRAVRRAGGGSPADPRFAFVPAMHDTGEKTVLGRVLPAGRGIEDGREVIGLLARHPSTARFIARKLVERFVLDTGDDALAAELETVFLETDGDLREVTRTLFTSPRFRDPAHRGAKVRTPFELVAASLRVTGAEVGVSRRIAETLRTLGHMPYMESAPTGYPTASDEWVNSGALLARMNLALDLAAGRVDGVRMAVRSADVSEVLQMLLPGTDTSRLEAAIRADAESASPARVLGLALGSPEFQRR